MLKSLPASISGALRTGPNRHAKSQSAADRLAAIMADIHGGDWRVSIRHDRRVIMMWAVDDAPVDKSNSGEN